MVKKVDKKSDITKTSKSDTKKFIKELDKSYKKLMKKIKKKGKDVRDDVTVVTSLKVMFESTVRMIPFAAKEYYSKPYPSNAYAYTGLVTKCCELMDALRSVTDLQSQVDYIQHTIIESAFRSIIQNLGDELFEVKRWVHVEFDKKQARRINSKLDNMLKNHGVLIKEILNKTSDDLHTYMVEQ